MEDNKSSSVPHGTDAAEVVVGGIGGGAGAESPASVDKILTG
jgi:hypothetical protein